MERRKLENPHQGMCFVQPERVFPRGRGKSQESGDLDADFEYFGVLTDLTKNVDKPLKKMPDLPGAFFQGFGQTFFQKSWNDVNWKIRTKECVLCNLNEFSHVSEENRKKIKIVMRILNILLSSQI